MFIERRLDKSKRIVLYCQTRFGILKVVKGFALSEGDVFLECGFLEDRYIKSKLSFLVLSIVVVIICIVAPEVHAAIQDGLISYWSLDEGSGTTAEDMVGGNDGDVRGGAAWVTGKFGSALSFDGADSKVPGSTVTDYVDCGSNSSLKPAHVTVAAWVKQSAISYYGQIAGFAWDTGDQESGYSIISDYYIGGTQGYIGWVSGGAAVDGNYTYKSTNFTLGQWTHVAMTYNGSEAIVYVNGVGGTSYTGESGDINYVYGSTFKMGLYQAGSWWLPFAGLIDDAAVWDRALTSQEIDFLYNGGSGNPVLGGDYAHVQVAESGDGTSVAEGGTSDSYEVVLGAAPSEEVQVTATPGDGQIDLGGGAGAAIVLTFTTENWDTPKTVNVSAYDDDVYEGKQPHITTITHSAEGAEYTGISIASVEVEVIDNELICGDWDYMRGDINKDCYVDLLDFAEFASEWMASL